MDFWRDLLGAEGARLFAQTLRQKDRKEKKNF
ncbi:hypothetical protein SMU40_04075 [Streptococcus mutans 15VF2]|nr:hypothetical protein SMU40_04075 [Streptococcus mutans 15VF2]